MYADYLDAIPLIADGAYDNNISQWNRAKDYWERNENIQRVKEIEKLIQKEINRYEI